MPTAPEPVVAEESQAVERPIKLAPLIIREALPEPVSLPKIFVAEKKKITLMTNPVLISEPDPELPLLTDLSAELQQAIPPMQFSGHTYSTDPEKRMIIINNKILREGEKIDEITLLKEITWEGAIVDFGGVLFKVENQ